MIKKILFVWLLVLPYYLFAQGANISFEKKIKEPYITISKDTINIGDVIQIKEGLNPDGTFRYVQKLNNFNEPKWYADSRNAFQIQKVKFFKQQNGVFYLFTEYFCINIEPAMEKKEIILK